MIKIRITCDMCKINFIEVESSQGIKALLDKVKSDEWKWIKHQQLFICPSCVKYCNERVKNE